MKQGIFFLLFFFYFFWQNYSLRFIQSQTQIFMSEIKLEIKSLIPFPKHMSLVPISTL